MNNKYSRIMQSHVAHRNTQSITIWILSIPKLDEIP